MIRQVRVSTGGRISRCDKNNGEKNNKNYIINNINNGNAINVDIISKQEK